MFMPRLRYRSAILLVLLLTVLAGCATQGSSGPSQAVEAYLQAMVSKNAEKMISLSCASWESQAQTEADSMTAVTARLEGLSCQESGKDGSTSLVTCKGKIVATYNNEDQDIPLEGRTYKVVMESNEWRMCGYK
jgi:hypothetical protein